MIEPTKERMVAQAGLAIVGNLLNQTNLVSRLNAYKLPDISRYRACSNGEVAKSYIGLLCQGKSDYDNIETFRDDAFLHWLWISRGFLPARLSGNDWTRPPWWKNGKRSCTKNHWI